MVPRRVPCTSRVEFENVFAWLFSSDGNVETQQRALDRISVWLARGSCPQAIESTADLLDATLQAARGSLSSHSLRLVYSMAIIRFVNGLVDPIQQGYYARSIGSIAQQLGLPAYFVDLRHAATHENLPSLTALRNAVKHALDWLYHRYWLHQMQPGDDAVDVDGPMRAELLELLHSYRQQTMLTFKDASRADVQKLEYTLSAIEKLAASQSNGTEELAALLADLLAQHSAQAIELSERFSDSSLSIPKHDQAVWMPLLQRLDDTLPSFAQALLLRMLESICAPDEEEELTSLSAVSTSRHLAAWSLLIATHMSSSENLTEIAIRLCLLHPNESTLAMLQDIESRAPGLQSLTSIAKVHTIRGPMPPAPENIDARLDSMDKRLQQLASALKDQPSSQSQSVKGDMEVDGTESWQLLPAEQWKPCPIGCLPNGRVADLTWPRAPVLVQA